MIYEISVNDIANQEQQFTLFGYQLKFALRFNTVGNGWCYDLLNMQTDEYITQNCWLSVNAPTLLGKNLPFVVMMTDGSGLGINCINQSEMGQRLQIHFIDKEVFHEAIHTAA